MAINNDYCKQPELVQGTLNLDPDAQILPEPSPALGPSTKPEGVRRVCVDGREIDIYPSGSAVEEMGMRPTQITQD